MGISPWQLILIVVILFILFPKRLGGLGSMLGKSLKDFKKTVKGDEQEASVKSSKDEDVVETTASKVDDKN